MGFGAGVLVSTVAYELVYEALHLAAVRGFPALGFFGGAFTSFVAEGRHGEHGDGRHRVHGAS